MGQKVHPGGLRLGIIRTWDSRWFDKKNYTDLLHEDLAIRALVKKKFRQAGISRTEIERVPSANRIKITINTAKPGIIIGKKGAGVEELKRNLIRMTKKTIQVNIQEIRQPELDAQLIAENICEQLEKRVAFRKAMRQALTRAVKGGAKGLRIECSGRLGGAEIARRERTFEGKVPLHTLRADIDFAIAEAYTTYGRIGVKVWVYRGDVLMERKIRRPQPQSEAAKAPVVAET